MKKALIISVLGLLFASSDLWAVGSPITPPSAGQKSLVPSRKDLRYQQSGNLFITGNVRGGKQFRGTIPYRSTTDFSGTLGSSSLDDFIKGSSGTDTIRANPGQVLPYYSATRTISKIENRYVVGSRARRDYNTDISITMPQTPQVQQYVQTLSKPKARPIVSPLARPLAQPAKDIDFGFRRDLYNIAYKTEYGKLKEAQEAKTKEAKEAEAKREAKRPLEEIEKKVDVLRPEKPEAEREPEEKVKKPSKDIFEQMKKFMEEREAAEKAKAKEEEAEAEEKAEEGEEEKPAKEGGISRSTREAVESAIESAQKIEKPELPTADAEKAAEIRGKHKTFAAYASDKFNNYMRLAEDYMHKGQYYKAADAYSFASIFKGEDPLPYAGKAFALFAAGEYMSSSYYLNKAIEVYPDYVKVPVDISALIGDRDQLETRIVDIKEWQERSKSGELAFLLAYVYYQIDKPDWAKEQIEKAKVQMPYEKAINSLDASIESKLGKTR